ncbi:phosphoglycerate dehydrogenase [Martelella alba]|uniref:3-phosphoglycerate dehydrogenase n=1 Tax=Martelella alba TaxID=2590451 RepID=A0ABY2SPS8_9HYPH|nr:phosphoglycerate dehydrogenase [Martelella alba]TKI07886.1 3-phosphoglycerate dehydrogenase [Martelella alba]
MNATTPEKILVLTEQFKNSDAIFDPLRRAGYDVEVNETFRLPTEQELIDKLKQNVVATIAGGEPYTERVFTQATNLKIVARWGVGYDKVNVAAATTAGVPIAMAFGANHESVAEFAYAMALTLACRLPQRDAMVKRGEWFFDGFHPGLWGRTAGIIGLGRIGYAMARRCHGANMRLLVCDPWASDEQLASVNAERVNLEKLLRQSDLVSIHAPSTPESRHTINADTLAMMKPGAILINTSRGPLIDENALVAALNAGKLGGVGMDVYEVEPLPADSPLRQFDHVLLSPHVSGMDKMAERLVTERCINNILDYLGGEKNALKPYVVNPEVLG